MLLDQVSYKNRQALYKLNNLTTPNKQWASLSSRNQKAIRLSVESAIQGSVVSTPRNISSFLLERLNIWVSPTEVQYVLSCTAVDNYVDNLTYNYVDNSTNKPLLAMY